MTYDFDISSDVSLSKILDEFILDGEKSSIIIEFLKQHDNVFKDILQYSLYCNKLFQLDFFLTCNYNDQKYIIDKLKEIELNDAAILTWQILKSNSGNVQRIKWSLKKDIDWILKNNIRHPYSYGHERFIAPFDDLCFKFAQLNDIANIPLYVNTNAMCEYFKYLTYSLFQDRLLQYDFVENLDNISKFVFLNTAIDTNTCKISAIKRLVLQILDSNEDDEVKDLCYKKIKEIILPSEILDDKTLNLVNCCKSFSELMLKMTIFNADASQSIVLYLLLFKKKWLKEWIEYDEENLNSYLNISHYARTL